ncbi:MAG: hypothetical protein HUK20_15210, partial [Fibrobacter sp.]|nr:hypothetical protein [Fibrobacter sp.]
MIDSLEGAHAGTYDPWSKTIFLFGGAKIIQLKPRLDGANMIIEKKAEIDLRKYLFREDSLTGPHTSGTGWRLDQGTVDGFGHLFVASQTGHVIFVDYHTTGFIDGPVMMHVQWIDNYLDDLAPLADVQVIRNQGKVDEDEDVQSEFTSSGSLVEMSSSSTVKSSSSAKRSSSSNTLVEWGSSSSVKSSGSTGSSNSTGNNSSGSNGGNSSSSTGGNGASSNSTGINSSGSNGGNSSGSTGGNGGSSNSTGVNSSGSNGGSSSGSTGGNGGNSSGSTGGNGGNDGNSSGSTGGNGGNDGSSSGSTGGNGGNDVNSSGSTGGGSHGSNSSSSGKPGEGSGKSSSATTPGAEDVDFDMSSSNVYFGAEDFDVDDFGDNGYPSTEDFNKGDSVVAGAVIMNPVGPGNTDGDLIHVGGNDYLLSTKPTGLDIELKGTDSAKVGQIIAITLDSNKVKEYFKDSD